MAWLGLTGQVYRTEDAPYYKQGNKVLIALAVASMFLFTAAKLYYDWRNRYIPFS